MQSPIHLAVLLSGNGTTLQNLLDRTADGRLNARIALVVSNRADAYGLVRAEQAGVSTAVVEAVNESLTRGAQWVTVDAGAVAR